MSLAVAWGCVAGQQAVPTDPVGVDTAAVVRDDCPDLDAPCAALAPRPTPRRCGAALVDAGSPVAWPDRLSALDCFDGGDPGAPGADLIPYGVVAPLFSQGADKGRFAVLPPGTTVTASPTGPWTFPDGTLLLKRFGDQVVEDGVAAERWFEVRAMLQVDGAWQFATWRWDPALGDGVLVDARGGWDAFTVRRPDGDHDVPWWYPNREGCTYCHRRSAEEALGPRSAQLDRVMDYDGVAANQLVAWYAAGLLDRRPTLGAGSLVDPYGDAAVEARARSWLHGNCAHCHQPGGFAPPDLPLDLRATTPTGDMHACGQPAVMGAGSAIVVPGDPDDSVLVERITADDAHRMPPDGALLVDEAGVEVVRRWIGSMKACP